MAKSPRFLDDDAYAEAFEEEIDIAAEIEASLLGEPAFARATFDVAFASNDPKKLAALAKQLTGLGYRMAAPASPQAGAFTCEGRSMPLPVGEHTVIFWAMDLFKLAAEHDCMLETYGASGDREPPLAGSGEQLFAEAMRAFERGNRGLALALFTQTLAVEPGNPNTWYSRACILDMIDLASAARRDYDQALELAPRFVAALVNRGANKDADEDYAGAIADYDRAIAINATHEAAFLNRGNSKLNAGDEAGAIADWKIAAGLGSATAKKRLSQYG